MSEPDARPGTYALVLAAAKRQTISVGRLGIFEVLPGFYASDCGCRSHLLFFNERPVPMDARIEVWRSTA